MIDIPSIIQGYAHGNFLMADDYQQLAWYSSHQRTLIPLDNRFRYPKSLQRVLNKNTFSVAINHDFWEFVEVVPIEGQLGFLEN